MPEMPEVQAHVERMTEALSGLSLASVQLHNFASLKTFDPPVDGAVGSKLVEVQRRAKYLLLQFDNSHTHVVHLMQGGRLRPDVKQSKAPRGGMVRWVFDNGDAWLLTEAGKERKAGVWAVAGDPLSQAPLQGLGVDADELTLDQLGKILAGQSKRLHGVLRSQKIVSGLGRMLANEICYEASLSPFVNASKLAPLEVERLYEAMINVVGRSTEHERTLDDIGKSADRPSKVHNRAGQACLDCGDTIRTIEYRRYTVFYCATRQTGGKVLADNATSKFLK